MRTTKKILLLILTCIEISKIAHAMEGEEIELFPRTIKSPQCINPQWWQVVIIIQPEVINLPDGKTVRKWKIPYPDYFDSINDPVSFNLDRSQVMRREDAYKIMEQENQNTQFYLSIHKKRM